MGEGRRFWMRMYKNFFSRHDITWLKSLPNGRDIVLFYIQLMLESIDHEGYLRFNEDLPYTNKMLAIITETELDIVDMAMEELLEYGMVERLDDGTLFLPKVPPLINSEADNDNANRQRRFRERQKELQKTDNVTENNANVTKRNESKSKSKSQSKSREREIKSNEISFAYKNSDDEKTQIVENSVENSPTIQDVQEYILASGRQVNVNHIWESTKGMQEYRGQRVYDWKGLVDSWAETQISIPYKF